MPLVEVAKRNRIQAERAQALAKAGQADKAAAELKALNDRHNLDSHAVYEMARAAALCAKTADDAHAERAVDWLNQCQAEGYFGPSRRGAQLRDEPDFAVIRGNEGCKALLSSVGK